MTDPRYTITLDGTPYCGESEESEEAPATTGAWWLANPVTRRSGLAFGTGPALVIEDRISLRSHMERILTRHREGRLPFDTITIRRTDGQ